MAIEYDEFNDEVVDARWTLSSDQPGVTISETADGFFEWFCNTACLNEWYYQLWTAPPTEIDIWTKLVLPVRADVIGNDAAVGIWFDVDGDNYWLDVGFAFTKSTDKDTNRDEIVVPRQYVLYVYMWGSEEEVDTIGALLGPDQNELWIRLRWDGTYGYVYYATSEPKLARDWILATPGVVMPLGTDNPGIWFSQWGASGNDTGKRFKIDFVRPWLYESLDPPSLDQYQRLQGYPKVTHPLVFNRNIGAFEVMHQPQPAAPLPVVEGSDVLAYDGSGNLSTITRTIQGITYVKTLTYTAGDLTYVSNWVEQ